MVCLVLYVHEKKTCGFSYFPRCVACTNDRTAKYFHVKRSKEKKKKKKNAVVNADRVSIGHTFRRCSILSETKFIFADEQYW